LSLEHKIKSVSIAFCTHQTAPLKTPTQLSTLIAPSGHGLFHPPIDIGSLVTSPQRKEDMDKDRIVGSAKQIKGEIEEAVGKAIGDAKLQVDGKADQAEGKAQNLAGTIKDTLKP
jgi:uncharacterized protein YjbJ (UPF0337 family)